MQPIAPAAPVQSTSGFTISGSTAGSTSGSTTSASDEMAKKVRGLNTDFLKYISKCVKEDCFADLSMVCQEYTQYLSKIEKEYPKKNDGELGPLPKDNQILPLTINFGAQKKQDGPVFSFSKPVIETPEKSFKAIEQKEEKPVFSFGKMGDTPAFGVKSMTPLTESSSFKFGSNTSLEKTEFSFEKAKDGDSQKFSFGTTPSNGGTVPSFNFTQKSNSLDKPAFDFTKNTSLATPFNFQMPKSDQKGSMFSTMPAPTFPVISAPTTTDSTGVEDEDNDMQPEEQVGDALMVAKAGEEDEVTLYSVRAKLRKFVDSKWEIIGLGLLKVNQNKSTKNSRIILRSESGKVLLNVSIFSGMTVTIKENTSVNFAASLSSGSLTTISAKVKEKNDATALQEAIERAKLKT